MQIFLLYRESLAKDKSLSLLQNAARLHNLPVTLINVENFDFTNVPSLDSGDIIYRIANGANAKKVERMLMKKNTTSFYKDSLSCLYEADETALHSVYGLKTPAIFPLVRTSEANLRKLVSAVHGYPFIIKTLGKSHGVGVQKIHGWAEFLAAAEQIHQSGASAVAKEYIDHDRHARLIVLGEKVVASIAYYPQGEEFRTNVGDTVVVKPEKFSPEIEALAVQAVSVSGYEFGGVDILLKRNSDEFFLAEVNFPCFFPRVSDATGIDVASLMVEYLLKKSTGA